MESSFIAKVIALGRITVPQTTRELLEIKPGDFVEVDIHKVIRRSESEFKHADLENVAPVEVEQN